MCTLSQKADAAQVALEAYQVAHVQMACAASKVSDMVAEHVFTPEEGIQALADFVKQYRLKLAEIDGRAST